MYGRSLETHGGIQKEKTPKFTPEEVAAFEEFKACVITDIRNAFMQGGHLNYFTSDDYRAATQKLKTQVGNDKASAFINDLYTEQETSMEQPQV